VLPGRRSFRSRVNTGISVTAHSTPHCAAKHTCTPARTLETGVSPARQEQQVRGCCTGCRVKQTWNSTGVRRSKCTMGTYHGPSTVSPLRHCCHTNRGGRGRRTTRGVECSLFWMCTVKSSELNCPLDGIGEPGAPVCSGTGPVDRCHLLLMPWNVQRNHCHGWRNRR
jgi:hypothetical protein